MGGAGVGAWLLGVVCLLSLRRPQGEQRWGPYPGAEQDAWGTGTEDAGRGQLYYSLLPRGQYPLNTCLEQSPPLLGHIGSVPPSPTPTLSPQVPLTGSRS